MKYLYQATFSNGEKASHRSPFDNYNWAIMLIWNNGQKHVDFFNATKSGAEARALSVRDKAPEHYGLLSFIGVQPIEAVELRGLSHI